MKTRSTGARTSFPSRVLSIVLPLVAAACSGGPQSFDLAALSPDALAHLDIDWPQPDAGTADEGVVTQLELPGCVDPDVPGLPPRPLWGQVVSPAGDGGSPYPDYKTISNNFTLLKSLKLLVSIVTKATKKLEKAEDGLERLGDPTLLDGVDGHCVCAGCNPPAAFNSAWDSATAHVDALLHGCSCGSGAGDPCPDAADQACQDVTPIGDVLDGVRTQVVEDLRNAARSALDNLDAGVEGAMHAAFQAVLAQQVDAVLSACGSTLTYAQLNDPALHAAVAQLLQSAEDDVKALWGNLKTLVAAFEDPAQSLGKVNKDLGALIAFFGAIDSIEDLGAIDWNDLKTRLTTLKTDVKAAWSDLKQLVDDLKPVLKDAGNNWDSLKTKIDAFQANETVQPVMDALSDLLGNASACYQQFSNPAWAPLSVDTFPAFRDAIVTHLQAWGQARWDDLYAEVTTDVTEAVIDHYLRPELIDPLTRMINGGLEGCHLRGTRAACEDYCNGANGGTDYDGVLLWAPTDVFKDPKKAALPAAQAALFVLKQIGWLDDISDVTQNPPVGSLLSGIQAALGVLGDIAELLQNAQEILTAFFEHVDRFTEGYHLGAYDVQRPDLHMCIGYAGHGAFAQMGNLGGGQVSIGARYTSHNLSRKHRFQVRSGGFSVSAFGKSLSLAPTLEINTQIDGWRMWDAQKPFGIPVNTAIAVTDIERYDVFHLVDANELSGSGLVNGGNVTWFVRDLYPTLYADASGAQHAWPRAEVVDVPAVYDRIPAEGRSTAVVSAGLNFSPEFKPKRWNLATIPVWPPAIYATPYFQLGAGVAWIHEASRFLDLIREKVNENLLPAEQLTDASFAREMHAFQAPDLTADDGTQAWVTPEVGVDVQVGFNVWKVFFGISLNLGLQVEVRPGGFGGVVDLNAALVDALSHSNPPEDAPCDPVYASQVDAICSNATFLDGEGQPLSASTYACTPSDANHSCCIVIDCQTEGKEACLKVAASVSLPIPTTLCMDEWVGITKGTCEALDKVNREELLDLLGKVPGFKTLKDKIAAVLAEDPALLFLTGTWNDKNCAEAACETKYTTAYLNLSSLSACASHGWCAYDDGAVVHDLTQAQCEGTEGKCVADYQAGPVTAATLVVDDATLHWTHWIEAGGLNLAGADPSTWIRYNERLAQGLADGLDEAGCGKNGWCLNFNYLPWTCPSLSDVCSAAHGYPQPAAAAFDPAGDAVLPADYPVMYVGTAATPDKCPTGKDHAGATLAGPADGMQGSVPVSRFIAYTWTPPTGKVGTFHPYQCENRLSETLTGWTGAGCSPLQQGYASACGCTSDGTCAPGEVCSEGRCMTPGSPPTAFSCLCAAGGPPCPAGRACVNGACMKTCGTDAECAAPMACVGYACRDPNGVPAAEEVVSGMLGVGAPLHAISSYAMSTLDFLSRLTLDLAVKAEFKIFGKIRTWTLFQYDDAWNVGHPTSKAWYQPGLEARYQSACQSAAGEGVTNRFPHARTDGNIPPFDILGVDPTRACFLAGNVCRYPEDPAFFGQYATFSDPWAFQAPNAGSLDEFLDWCKADMPAHVEDPAPNSNDQIVGDIVDTYAWGESIGMELWAQSQICIDGKLWNEWIYGLQEDLADRECGYDDPVTGQSHTFPCGEINEAMLRAWGCLDVAGSNPWAAELAMFPYWPLWTTGPNGAVFDLSAIFDPVPMTDAQGQPVYQPDGSPATELQLTLAAMKPQVRGWTGPLWHPLVAARWLEGVLACFDARYMAANESACRCTTDADCSAGLRGLQDETRRCTAGACEAWRPQGSCNGTPGCTLPFAWTRMECGIVHLEGVTVGPCCGDGIIESSANPPYTEECDDGNTVDGDGCSSLCRKDGGTPPDPDRCGQDLNPKCEVRDCLTADGLGGVCARSGSSCLCKPYQSGDPCSHATNPQCEAIACDDGYAQTTDDRCRYVKDADGVEYCKCVGLAQLTPCGPTLNPDCTPSDCKVDGQPGRCGTTASGCGCVAAPCDDGFNPKCEERACDDGDATTTKDHCVLRDGACTCAGLSACSADLNPKCEAVTCSQGGAVGVCAADAKVGCACRAVVSCAQSCTKLGGCVCEPGRCEVKPGSGEYAWCGYKDGADPACGCWYAESPKDPCTAASNAEECAKYGTANPKCLPGGSSGACLWNGSSCRCAQ